MSLSTVIKERALALGFDLVGVATVEAWKDLEFSKAWVERGYAGEMRYLENPKRHDPRLILPSAKSVVCVGLVYNAPLPYSTEVSRPWSVVSGQLQKPEDQGQRTTDQEDAGARPRAWISRYAWGSDYHPTLRAKLEQLRAALDALAPGVETRVYVDTGPIVERAFARYSGIGWVGKNTCLINEAKGSWIFLGVVLTSLELDPDLPAPDRCGSCTRCLEACPTGALVEPYVMDASRCIAYFNIELKGAIPEQYRPAIGANVFGCDICQDVCPWNARDSRQRSAFSGQSEDQNTHLTDPHPRRSVATTDLPEFQPMEVEVRRPARSLPQPTTDHGQQTHGRVSNFDFRVSPFSLFNAPLDALATITEEDFRRVFARSPIKRAKYRGWLRNLCVAMGNSGDPRFLPWLARAREDPDPIIREHAEWALARLQGTGNR